MFPVTARDEMRGAAGDDDVFGAPNEIAAFGDRRPHRHLGRSDAATVGDPRVRRLVQPGLPHRPDRRARFPARRQRHRRLRDQGVDTARQPLGALRRRRRDGSFRRSQARRPALLRRCRLRPVPQRQPVHRSGSARHRRAAGRAGQRRRGAAGLRPRSRDRRTPPIATPSARRRCATSPLPARGCTTAPSPRCAPPSCITSTRQARCATTTRPSSHRCCREPFGATRRRSAPSSPNLDPLVATPQHLSDAEVNELLTFLEALTDPAAVDLRADVPSSVPSGLPVAD